MRMMLSDNNHAAAEDDDASSTEPLLVTPAGGAALLPPAAGVGGSASAGGVVYPDSNTVVILAALLCVLVCALGLNSLFRCARHCGGRGGGSLHAGAAAARAAATMAVAAHHPPAAAVVVGLDKRELGKIPVVEYETKTDKASAAGGAGGTDECAICLGEFVDGEKVRVLPGCRHGFHVTCIDGWLAAHSSCPICRNSLLDENRGAGAGEAATVQGEFEAT